MPAHPDNKINLLCWLFGIPFIIASARYEVKADGSVYRVGVLLPDIRIEENKGYYFLETRKGT